MRGAAVSGRSVHRRYLGVMVDNVSPETAASLHLKEGSGAAITGVDQDGPACRAGLKSGDIVTAFNGKPVEGPEQFASLIHGSAPGSTVSMTVMRDGQSKEMKVTLGDWKQMAHMPKPPLPPHGKHGVALPPAPPLPPRMYPDIDIRVSHADLGAHGIVVEPLSPQLCDFFGVPQNKGVLVRSVEKGSPGAAAGLKAGDVIVRVNNETMHDMADWRRALKTHSGKVTLAIVRDKKEQNIGNELAGEYLGVAGRGLGRLRPGHAGDGGWRCSSWVRNSSADARDDGQLDPEQIDEIDRQAQAAAKTVTPDMKKQAEEVRKQAEMRKEAEKGCDDSGDEEAGRRSCVSRRRNGRSNRSKCAKRWRR